MNDFLERLHNSIVENVPNDGTAFLKTLDTILVQGSNGNLVKLKLFSGSEHRIEIRTINKNIGEVDSHRINSPHSLIDKEEDLFSDIAFYLDCFLS